MTAIETVTALRNEASNNKAFSAICHIFAFRKRARNTLTVSGLAQRMKLEGFNFEQADYVHALKFLAKLGFGRLEMQGGKVIALKDVKVTLQSIGEAAVGNQAGFKSFSQRNRYKALQTANKAVVEKVWQAAPTPRTKVTLAVEINGKLIKLEVPNNFTGEEIASVIKGLQGFPRQASAAA